jgi:PAS domain S-box-containing protein
MPNMSESFFIISWSSWVIGSALVLAMLVAVVLFRAAENLKKSSGCRQKKLWVIVGGVLSGLLLWGLPVTQLLMLPVATLDPSGMLLLLAALAVGILGAGVIQWLLGHQRLGISQLAMGGVVMGTALIGLDALLWTSVRLQLVVPHEPGQEWLLGLCWVVSVLTFAVALWLPAQPRSDSLYLRFLQRWLSPFLLGLGLASQVLMGMVFSSFLPTLRSAAYGVLYPALGHQVISNLLFIETLGFMIVMALFAFYVARTQQEGAAQIKGVMSTNAIGVILCDYDGHFLCVNDAFLEMVGYGRSELTSTVSWSDLTPPEFEGLDRQATDALKSASIISDYEKQLLRKDGQRVDVFIAALSRVPNYDNTAIAYVMDITEKNKALLGLRESEARFRQLGDSNLIGVVFWNIYGRIYDANEVFLAMLGYTRDDLQAGEMNWRKVILASDEVTQAAMVQQAIAGEKVEPYETVFIHRDGSLVNVQVGFAMLHGAREEGFSFVQDISERKRAEVALLENYQRINLILEAIPHKVWTAEANGRSSYSNQNLLKYVGLSLAEMNEAGWAVYLHPEDLQGTVAQWEMSLKTEQHFEAICRLKRDDGFYRWHLSTAHPVYNQSGQLILWVGTNTDIHEMKLAQDRLKESEARFRSMAEQAPIMIWVTDAVGKLTYLNQRFLAFIDFPSGVLSQSSRFHGVNPEDAEGVQRAWEESLQQQRDFEMTYRQRRYDGEERWVLSTGAPTYSADGEFLGMVGTMIDITDQKRMKEALEAEVTSRTTALQESMTLMHSIVENVPSMIFLKEANELRFKLFNKVGRELIGFTETDYLDKTDYDFFSPEQADFFVEKDRQTLNGLNLVDIPEESIKTATGEIHLLHTKKVPILDKHGKPAYLLGVSEDITEFKKAQDQIISLNQKLQEQVQTISAANKALESFSYSVSHDLRAPLRSIDGYSQVVLENYSEQLDDTGKHYLQRVREGSQQMAKLIDDMLNLSRLSRSELKKEEVNLSEIVRSIAQELQVSEPQRQVEFKIEMGLLAQADKRLMQSVLQNLLDNAWKFTSRHAQALIEFGKMEYPDQSGQGVYFMRDDGAGFDMSYADKLFGTFQRLHDASEFTGTGIGLASAQRIINRHGGEIWAESEVEQGATFYFTL